MTEVAIARREEVKPTTGFAQSETKPTTTMMMMMKYECGLTTVTTGESSSIHPPSHRKECIDGVHNYSGKKRQITETADENDLKR